MPVAIDKSFRGQQTEPDSAWKCRLPVAWAGYPRAADRAHSSRVL